MEEIERDPIKAAVEGMLRTDILLEFLEELKLPPVTILEGVRRAGNRVISNQVEELQDENFRLLVVSLCAEVSAILIGDRVDSGELASIVEESLKRRKAERAEVETDTYQ